MWKLVLHIEWNMWFYLLKNVIKIPAKFVDMYFIG